MGKDLFGEVRNEREGGKAKARERWKKKQQQKAQPERKRTDVLWRTKREGREERWTDHDFFLESFS